jgi:ATP-dependent DNA helicase RecG
MTSTLDKLEKILQLEREQNHRDKAVIGGLARFADNWREQALQEMDNEEWVNQIAEQMRAYSQLVTQEERQASLEALRADLAGSRTPNQEPVGDSRSEDTAKPVPLASRVPPESSPEPVQRRRRHETATALEDIGLDSPIIALSGIGPTQSRRLARLGVHTVRDMVYFFPRRYDDFSTLKTINQLEYGEEVTVMGRVENVSTRRTRSGKIIVRAVLDDGSGVIEATWFNQPHLGRQLKPTRQVVVSGRVDEFLGRLTFQSPEWEPLDRQLLHTARLVPIYPLTDGLSARWLRKTVKRTVDYWSHRMPDHLPDELRERVGLLDLETALRQVHFPDDLNRLERARYRLAFDELFHVVPVDDDTLERFVLGLPFVLTSAQQRALGEIVQDLRCDRPMNRLLQGDVGSGKTVVAAAAMALTTAAGAQTALMAPTEILAEQHYRTITQLFGALDAAQGDTAQTRTDVRLLTGSTPQPERDVIYRGLADGSVGVVIGTHALIQEGVEFKNLVLAITDEQHRFGVAQRAALRQKGYNPHMLVMTATPIPRSLALTVYGDLDSSIIDEMPPGRRPVQTRVLLPTERERAYGFVRSQIERGRQAFIICPLVEESEKIEAKAAVEEHRRLQNQIFPNLRLGLLHGRMKGEEKEGVMGQFVRGELDILVSTSVVEVGIDVPNASVMLIEGANRFGLAQLHQFRGRVGRGEHESYCVLIADSTTAASEERLAAVEETDDGFALAETDLELRGPGEFFGTRQSGLPDLRVAGLADVRLLEIARGEATRLFDADPELADPDLRLLVQQVDRFWLGEGDVS